MSDLVLLLSLSVSVLIVVLFALMLWQGRKRAASTEDEDTGQEQRRRVRLPPAPAAEGPRRRNVRQNRIPLRPEPPPMAVGDDEDGDDGDDDGADELGDVIDLPDGKIGAKKRRKLEMKAEKRAQRERDVQEREERKERQAKEEERRRREDEKRKREEQEKEEEERLAREEKERQEYEAYLELKKSFAVEEEGFEEEVGDEASNKLMEFIDHIKTQKVVLMEELAGHFKMKTQDVIQRIQDLVAQQQLVGVIDDRGKFIYISREDLESVAKFIKQRGRVSVADLVERSNDLINLVPGTGKSST